jgi:hypothetical protein
MSELSDKLERLRVARNSLAMARARLSESKQAGEELNRHNILRVEVLADEVSTLEGDIRTMTVREWEETGSKKPVPGVAIRLLNKLDYDPTVALEWAKEHRLAVKLDTKIFESIAKTTILPFVTTRVVPQATIATDLGGVIGDELTEHAVDSEGAWTMGTPGGTD